MEQLDEKGFVFLDGNDRPYWIRMWGGAPWIFRWHADNHWVSLRQTNQTEIWLCYEIKLTDEQAEHYHTANEK